MISKRKKELIKKILSNISFDKDLFKFTINYFKRIKISSNRFSGKDLPYPTTLMLELTNKCNLHCITCPREYAYGRRMDSGNMNDDLAIKIIDECYPYLQSIGLTGMGETLFAPNLLKIAKYIKNKKKSIVIFISTNANIPGFIDRVKDVLPYIDSLQISTDGIYDTYERIRKGADFSTLVNNIESLIPLAVENNVDIRFNMVITKLNYTSMSELIEFAVPRGIKYVNYTYFNLASVTDIPLEYYEFFHSDEFRNELQKTTQTVEKYKNIIEVTGLDFPTRLGSKKCPLLWNHYQINYNGEVPPCCAKPFSKEYSFGNVSDSKVIDVLNSENAKKFRDSWGNNEEVEFCRKCHFVRL